MSDIHNMFAGLQYGVLEKDCCDCDVVRCIECDTITPQVRFFCIFVSIPLLCKKDGNMNKVFNAIIVQAGWLMGKREWGIIQA